MQKIIIVQVDAFEVNIVVQIVFSLINHIVGEQYKYDQCDLIGYSKIWY